MVQLAGLCQRDAGGSRVPLILNAHWASLYSVSQNRPAPRTRGLCSDTRGTLRGEQCRPLRCPALLMTVVLTRSSGGPPLLFAVPSVLHPCSRISAFIEMRDRVY